MENLPLITIGVSTYNRKDYLKQSLDSLLAQTYPNCEIIVIDDGSIDDTGEMVKDCYPQVKYVYQENAGDSAAKNHAASIGSGKYVVFNDSDDVFLPDAVERLFKALPENEENACSYGTYITIDSENNELPTKRKTTVLPSGRITGDLIRHILVNCTATLMPRQLFLANGGLGSVRQVAADYSCFLKLSLLANFYAVQKPVFLRRRHGGNLSAASYSKQLKVLTVLEDFLQQHPQIEAEFSETVRARRAVLHSKLCREARKEKRLAEAAEHARLAYKYDPSIKNFFRKIFC